MEKQKKSVGTIALVILLLIVTIVSLVLATYAWAKYTTTNTSNASANVAKWNVAFTPGNNNFTGSYTHVSTGKIAPGTSGTFTVEVVPGTTEVCFDYTITKKAFKLVKVEGGTETEVTGCLNGESGPTAADVLSHISLTCGDVDFKTNPIKGRYELNGHTTNNVTTSGTIVDNSIAVGDVARTGGVYTFTWNWPYQLNDGTNEAKAAYDAIDTAAGEYAATHDLRLKVEYEMTAVQTEPNGTHIN